METRASRDVDFSETGTAKPVKLVNLMKLCDISDIKT